jgi:hypothetical protein
VQDPIQEDSPNPFSPQPMAAAVPDICAQQGGREGLAQQHTYRDQQGGREGLAQQHTYRDQQEQQGHRAASLNAAGAATAAAGAAPQAAAGREDLWARYRQKFPQSQAGLQGGGAGAIVSGGAITAAARPAVAAADPAAAQQLLQSPLPLVSDEEGGEEDDTLELRAEVIHGSIHPRSGTGTAGVTGSSSGSAAVDFSIQSLPPSGGGRGGDVARLHHWSTSLSAMGAKQVHGGTAGQPTNGPSPGRGGLGEAIAAAGSRGAASAAAIAAMKAAAAISPPRAQPFALSNPPVLATQLLPAAKPRAAAVQPSVTLPPGSPVPSMGRAASLARSGLGAGRGPEAAGVPELKEVEEEVGGLCVFCVCFVWAHPSAFACVCFICADASGFAYACVTMRAHVCVSCF